MRVPSSHRDDVLRFGMNTWTCSDAALEVWYSTLRMFGLEERGVGREEGGGVRIWVLFASVLILVDEHADYYTQVNCAERYDSDDGDEPPTPSVESKMAYWPRLVAVHRALEQSGSNISGSLMIFQLGKDQVAVLSHSSTRTSSSMASPANVLLKTTQWLTKAYLLTVYTFIPSSEHVSQNDHQRQTRRELAYNHPNIMLTHISLYPSIGNEDADAWHDDTPPHPMPHTTLCLTPIHPLPLVVQFSKVLIVTDHRLSVTHSHLTNGRAQDGFWSNMDVTGQPVLWFRN
ncbi:hypothetical protein BJ165DRAFT_1406105 [Panaeolus papilionaceus]|nr:hypothetical protein BJ165DRAFT_1406105 [Panaeolus papilionaceus]